MMRGWRTALVVVAALLAVPGVASAHEIAGRFEAPIPLPLLFGGAAVTVGVTAVVLAFTSTVPGDSTDRQFAPLPSGLATGIRIAGRSLFVLAFVLTIGIGLVGRQVAAENFATVFVWAVWLKGIAIIAALAGSPWQTLSPWRTLYNALTRIEGDTIAVGGGYPRWLGAWPALIGFVLWIGIIENLTTVPRSPQLTAVLVLLYTMVMLAGGILYGPVWFERADALAVLYRLFGRVAPARIVTTGEDSSRVQFRAPWQACTTPVAGVGVAAFVVAAVYTVSFDGFTSTPEYQTLLFGARQAASGLPVLAVLLYLGGFGGFLAVFALVMWATEWIAKEDTRQWKTAVLAFAPTILPIAVAYEIAHNYPFVVANLGQLITILWSLVAGGHGPEIDLLGWLSLSLFWWSQVVLIVVGHLVAVVAAHTVALARYPSVTAARRGHVPLTLLMIGYTVLSLWIISRPIVTG